MFRKPTPPPPDRATPRRGPEARSDRPLVIPARVASSLSRTVREQLAYLTPDQQRAFLWRYRAQAKSPVVALAFLPLGWHYLYLRKRGLQVLFWLTLGGLAAWWVLDFFRIRRLVRDYNRRVAMHVMRALWG
ncbi:MAG TPA: TM2 domain-containing protein [Candidatus Limnocylindria bacterium]|nr:TM2 domain-containing protein [Candidatus Limnocylindria bacterium]